MTCYPIIIPTLNRFSHFKTCVESLANCAHAAETELIIGLDFPPAEKYVDGWKKIKKYIPQIKGFRNVEVLERDENFGSSKNSCSLQDYALSKYDAYIYTEDDNVFSPNFLDFINKGLEKYKDDENVIAVCGYSYPIDWKTSENAVLQHNYFSAWGYGEWGNKRNSMLQTLSPEFIKNALLDKSEYSELKKSPKNRIMTAFNFSREKIPCMDITRSIYMTVKQKYVLMPAVSLVRNTGWDGSGEHCSKYGMKIKDIFSKQKISEESSFKLNAAEKIEHSKNLEVFQMKIYEKNTLNKIKADIAIILIRIFGMNLAKSILKICFKTRQKLQFF